MGRTASLLIVAFTLGVAPLLTASPLRAEEAALITSYFEKLRDQGLFGLAERYAIDRRAELPLSLIHI